MYLCIVCIYSHTYSKSMDQPGKVVNPARGQLNRENHIPLSPCVPENSVSQSGFGSDQPGKVVNPARGQLNRENHIPLSPCVPENLVSQSGFGSPVPRQPAHLQTQTESGAFLWDASRVPRRRPFIYLKPPYAIGYVTSLSGHAKVYRWCSLPRVCRHRASKPQRSSERVLPWQVTAEQLICAYLSHTHYWYEVGVLKITAICKTRCVPLCLIE